MKQQLLYIMQCFFMLHCAVAQPVGAEDMVDKTGWLSLGFYGHQPEIAEGYISTGSLYVCTEIFLVPGLAGDASFWTAPFQPWSQKIGSSGKG